MTNKKEPSEKELREKAGMEPLPLREEELRKKAGMEPLPPYTPQSRKKVTQQTSR